MELAEMKRLTKLHDKADELGVLYANIADRFQQDGDVELYVLIPQSSDTADAGEQVEPTVKVRASAVLYMLGGLRTSMINELRAAGVSDAA